MPTPVTLDHYWRFGSFYLDSRHQVLQKRVGEQLIQFRLPQAETRLLCLFLQTAGEVQHKDLLLQHGWCNRPVSSGSLPVAITNLRRYLDTTPLEAEICTLPKQGYLLALHVPLTHQSTPFNTQFDDAGDQATVGPVERDLDPSIVEITDAAIPQAADVESPTMPPQSSGAVEATSDHDADGLLDQKAPTLSAAEVTAQPSVAPALSYQDVNRHVTLSPSTAGHPWSSILINTAACAMTLVMLLLLVRALTDWVSVSCQTAGSGVRCHTQLPSPIPAQVAAGHVVLQAGSVSQTVALTKVAP